MNANLPILIIGQGIAGTLLSFELWQRGIPFVIMDIADKNTASQVSGAALNPFSGRTKAGILRRSKMYDTAVEKYTAIEQLLKMNLIHFTPLLQFDSEQSDHAFIPELADCFETQKNLEIFEGVAVVNNQKLLQAWRFFLKQQNCLWEEWFDESLLELKEDFIMYQAQAFQKIIYCNGVSAMESKYYTDVRFTKNRGDVLLLNIKGLPPNYIYQKNNIRLLPKDEQLFWCGSNYLWDYDEMIPNENWKQASLKILEQWLKIDFELVDHLCAKRPTTAGQIPAIGKHPIYPQLYICNGLGTKGYSAGPLWIADFVQVLAGEKTETLYQSTLNKWLLPKEGKRR